MHDYLMHKFFYCELCIKKLYIMQFFKYNGKSKSVGI